MNQPRSVSGRCPGSRIVHGYHQAMRLYVHGAGRTGTDAWPSATHDGVVFADLDTTAPAVEQAVALSQIQVTAPVTVIAHSFGAVPVLFALREGYLRMDHLVLAEPALYDIARGDLAIETHISAMSKARQRADEGDLEAYWRIVRPLMFGGPFVREKWGSEQTLARRFSRQTPPWGHDITADVIEPVHTLVLTGGWNAEYEAIASALSQHGATHIRLEGNKHRVQDHRDFEGAISQFLTTG
ncbi:alpha/beta hydrolase [Humibacter sp.]|uniref:alpha/beta hydrolase n=1 Tax=Humibacter sp. TaxID=1940291 RepID=UPI003F7F17C9